MIFFTYTLIGPDGVRYIGKTSNPKKRMSEHRRQARVGRQTHLYNWMRAVGVEDVEMTVTLAFETEDEALAAEVRQIAGFRARGYNLTDGGEGVYGLSHSPEARAKMSAAAIGNSRRSGTATSPEGRANISAGHVGRQYKGHSPESREKMSVSMMGNKNILVRTISPETRAKMSASQRNRLARKKAS